MLWRGDQAGPPPLQALREWLLAVLPIIYSTVVEACRLLLSLALLNVNCVFTCISLELQVRTGSNLVTRYRYHPRSQSYQVRSTIGRNDRVVWGEWCLVQIWHIFFTQGLQFITHLLFGSDFTVQPSPVL